MSSYREPLTKMYILPAQSACNVFIHKGQVGVKKNSGNKDISNVNKIVVKVCNDRLITISQKGYISFRNLTRNDVQQK